MAEDFEATFRALFRKHYAGLLFYAARLVGEEEAEDVVQDVFAELWHRREAVTVGGQIEAFLYRAVYTRSLNVLKHREVRNSYEEVVQEIHRRRVEFYSPDNTEVIRRIEDRELRKRLLAAIGNLPDKCRQVFRLSYLHGLKNKDIAETMGISLRTVEAHMYKALKMLREQLADGQALVLLFFAYGLSVFFGQVVIGI